MQDTIYRLIKDRKYLKNDLSYFFFPAYIGKSKSSLSLNISIIFFPQKKNTRNLLLKFQFQCSILYNTFCKYLFKNKADMNYSPKNPYLKIKKN